MSNIFQSIFLGIVQGLTEFIPVSSSAHLVILQNLFGMRAPQIFFDIVLHIGTLCAVVLYFRVEIIDLLKSVFKPHSEGFRFIVLLVISTMVTGVIGFFCKDYFERLFSSPVYSAVFLIVTGCILFLTKFKKKTEKGVGQVSYTDAVVIGFAQGIAIAPGISRSGSTIAAGIWRGLDKKFCAKYSLLLSIPAILGAALSEFGGVKACTAGCFTNIFLGFLAAFLVGYVAIAILIKVLEKAKFYMFSYYCWIVGSISFLYFTMR